MNARPSEDLFVELASIGDVEKLRRLLTDEERSAAGRLVNSTVRARFEASRGLRRKMLSEVVGIAPNEVKFRQDDDGKPRAENARGWDFNVSHSGDWVAVVVARGAAGIDIEMIRHVREQEAIVVRYFHPEEAEAWRGSSPGFREEAFFVLWSAREAAMKCLGLGLAKGLSVTRVDPEILREVEGSARVGAMKVSVRRIEVPRGYVGMVALGGGR